MRRALIGLLAGWTAFSLGGAPARAQDMTFDVEEAEAETPTEGEGETPLVEGEGEGEAGIDIGGDIIGDLAAGDDGQQAVTRDRAPRSTEAVEEIFAVQQIYALRINRVELAPSISQTVNDQYVSHPGLGVGLNYWWTNVLALGLNFIWYQGLENESDLNFFVRRSTRLAVPITEYQLGAHLNFTYVPVYGKFTMFNEYIFQWDMYIVGGVGIMRTRPVPVVDPEIRNFPFDWRIAFNAGVGLRIFITRWLSIFAELRDYAYLERLENLNVALGFAPNRNADCPGEYRDCDNTWLDDSVSLTNNVTAHLGISIFLPFDFEYRLPK